MCVKLSEIIHFSEGLIFGNLNIALHSNIELRPNEYIQMTKCDSFWAQKSLKWDPETNIMSQFLGILYDFPTRILFLDYK